MFKRHNIQLIPTKSQEVFFKKSCGIARFAYNWALTEWENRFRAGEATSAYFLTRRLNALKKQNWPWMLEVNCKAPEHAILNLEQSYLKFFKKTHKNPPKFKKKGNEESFMAASEGRRTEIKANKIWVPRLGWVKMCELLRFNGKVKNVVIKRYANKWFASVLVDVPIEPIMRESQSIIGIDLGINALATLSNGFKYYAKKPLAEYFHIIKREHRRLDRKKKGSSNQEKQRLKLSKLYYRIRNIRRNQTHEITSDIIKKYDVIVLEDLPLRNLIKNSRLSRQLHDVNLGEFRRQIEYKAQWAGVKVIIADRFYPSSKLCSFCGYKRDKMFLNVRNWCCDKCNTVHDRDINAAKNLEIYPTAKLVGSNAYGDAKVHPVMEVSVDEVGSSV